ncbi:MAG: thymidine phosphorylase, partial [Planctomycetota bacterium]
LSDAAWRALGVAPGAVVEVRHPDPVESIHDVRGRMFGKPLDERQLLAIMQDVVAGRYSDIELAAFVATMSTSFDIPESVAMTRAMIAVGDRLSWPQPVVADKHCVGGLPGNRTTMLVVPIVAAAGHLIPKTSSRAITSPAGTADTMEVLTRVDLSLAEMRRVVEKESGCIVWGGNVSLSPADDILIRVERALDLDGPAQLVASVLSKKAAAGSTHVVIDIPVGPTAKVRTWRDAAALKGLMLAVADEIGLRLRVRRTDGSQPVVRGIGPALEARDVLAVLRRDPEAPQDLRERALLLASELLALVEDTTAEAAYARAVTILDSGDAEQKFLAICEAQGGFREPVPGHHRLDVTAPAAARVRAIDNRRLATVARL